jgi:hypothetical protein
MLKKAWDSVSLRTETLKVMLEIRGNMGQCKSKDREFKSYANAVFRFCTGTQKEVKI